MPEFTDRSSAPPYQAVAPERRPAAPARIKDGDRLVLALQALSRGLELTLGTGVYRMFKRGQTVRTPAGWLELEEDRLLRRTAAPQGLARHFLSGPRHPCPHPSTPHASNPAAYALYVDEDVTVNWLMQAVSQVDEATLTRWAIESVALVALPGTRPTAEPVAAEGAAPASPASSMVPQAEKAPHLHLVQATG